MAAQPEPKIVERFGLFHVFPGEVYIPVPGGLRETREQAVAQKALFGHTRVGRVLIEEPA
jgi:hypothetical protein